MAEQSYLFSWLGPIIGVIIGFALTSLKEQLYYKRETRKSKIRRRIDILVECLKLHEQLKTVRIKDNGWMEDDRGYDQVISALSGLKPWLLMLELHSEVGQAQRIRAAHDKIESCLQDARDLHPGYRRVPGRQILELRDEMQTILMDSCQTTFNEYEIAEMGMAGREMCADICAIISLIHERVKSALK